MAQVTTRRESLDPPRRQHYAVRRLERVGAPAEQVGAPRERLLEEALRLEHLAEDDAQHLRVAGVGHLIDARPPAVDECLRVAGVLLEDRARSAGAIGSPQSRQIP